MHRLPFFHPLALGAFAATFGGVALAWWATDGAIASPGGLSTSRGDGAARGGVQSHAELGARCGACHPPPWASEATSERCLGCHDEIERELGQDGLHAHLGTERRCLGCHHEHLGAEGELTAFDPETFPHDATGFSLGAHRQTSDGRAFACRDCHERGFGPLPDASCAACHRADPGDFLAGHVAAWGEACRACHDGVDRFSSYDHGATAFALEGAHAPLACGRCHAGARELAAFGAADARCAGCHAKDDVHRGGFGDDCAACHGAAAWKPATFDHGRTSFPLTGAHARLSCDACHRDGRWAGTPTTCRACHAPPADHGAFGDECAGCHGTDTWKGARFDHRFPVDHGARGPSPCATCHPSGYDRYTCFGCHEHTPANVAAEHHEEGIGDLSDCARCHPTGREKEGGGEHGDRGEHGGREDDD